MPKFVIEREIVGAGKLSSGDLHAISQKSCSVLRARTRVSFVVAYFPSRCPVPSRPSRRTSA